MKKRIITMLAASGMLAAQCFTVKAQTVSTFENLTLSSGTFWNGASTPLGTSFSSGNAVFPNYFDTSYGGYWTKGWAYSNMQDSTTAGLTNMYSARTAKGANSSSNYVVGQPGAVIKLTGTASGKAVNGFYVTNGTYPALSMKNGDNYAKKFGGATGNDADWFKLTVRKWLGGVMTNDSVEFYLADYRFTDNSKDYIVTTWQWVNLTSLGNVDSLQFNLSSSDAGAYGMNTPAFFCMDNFTTADSPLVVSKLNYNKFSIAVFPNPSSDFISISLGDLTLQTVTISIFDVTGKIVFLKKNHLASLPVSIAHLPIGMYYLKAVADNHTTSKTFVKE